FGLIVRAQPKFAVVVACNPKHIITGLWRANVTADARAIVYSSIHRSFERRKTFASVGRCFEWNLTGEIYSHVRPIFSGDCTRRFADQLVMERKNIRSCDWCFKYYGGQLPRNSKVIGAHPLFM